MSLTAPQAPPQSHHDASNTMAGKILPYEVKRLVYNYLDLDSIKSLRLVSKSWSTVGAELLLLPEFVVKSSSFDIPRLLKITENPNLAPRAAKTIKTFKFWSNDWDPNYLRAILCSRHAQVAEYQMVDFVPNQVEQDALDELELAIKIRALDNSQDEHIPDMLNALERLPEITGIHFIYPNPFKGKLLRKTWEEYSLEAVRPQVLTKGLNRFVNIISAATEAGLCIQQLYHEQLPPEFFFLENNHGLPYDIVPYVGNLRSLDLNINNAYSSTSIQFQSSEIASQKLHEILCACPLLDNLKIRFLTTQYIPLTFLPPDPFTNLKSLMLSGVRVDPVQYMRFLEGHSKTLVRLSLSDFVLDGMSDDWMPFLETLRDRIGQKLEKFQFCGQMNVANLQQSVAIMLWPIYKEDWSDYTAPRIGRTKGLEDFIIRGGPWPFGEEQYTDIIM